ncbi:hypothetical protein, partial [Rhizobium sp. SEMIA 4088]|uniref:hypothetical protein n=1 Tax=Rhizobium sp. SEMIA 4088 TaxID=2137763 RepID=UPI0010FFE7B8
ASLRDLAHRVTLKLFAEIRFAHDALLASKLGKKASTNLGAIQLTFPWTRKGMSFRQVFLKLPSLTSGTTSIAFWLCL